MTADTVAHLRALQARLADRKRWIKHVVACNSEGRVCDPNDPDAVAWCLNGHMRAMGLMWHLPAATLITEAALARYHRRPSKVNDNLGLKAVRLVVADAIAAAEAEGGTP